MIVLFLNLIYILRFISSYINPIMKSGLFYHDRLDWSIFIRRGLISYYCSMFDINSYIQCKQCRPDQTPQNAASDLGLHCLSVSLLWGARHKCIKLLAFIQYF